MRKQHTEVTKRMLLRPMHRASATESQNCRRPALWGGSRTRAVTLRPRNTPVAEGPKRLGGAGAVVPVSNRGDVAMIHQPLAFHPRLVREGAQDVRQFRPA